jgi:hypothetical protein
MPDFDEKQDAWNPTGAFTWCGPIAAADTLWWLDSEYESVVYPNPVPPPTISDHFPLVPAFSTTMDDHDPRNVAPLVPLMASLMDTDGIHSGVAHVGTRFADLVTGIQTYLTVQGVSRFFEVHSTQFPNFAWIDSETEKCQGVILFLEFQQYVGGGVWTNSSLHTDSLRGGHFVAVAGVNATLSETLISDPLQDAYEMGTDPLGRQPVVPLVHGPTVHNDTQYVSQDGYSITLWNPPPPVPGSPYGVPVLELVNYLQTLDPSYPENWHTFIRAAVATSPIPISEWPGYIKPAYPDYAPSGMPDFNEKQDTWGPQVDAYTWCVPVAVADSLWWLDSKYESIFNPAPVAPPTISDHFNLVTSYNSSQWDDHSPSNVDPLVRNLALLMNTDGQTSGGDHTGTRWTDIQTGIQKYLKQQGVAGMFEVHNASYANFTWIDNETETCQDVELFLEFWQFTGTWQQPITNPSLEFGHCVACAGANSTASQILISDPYLDAYEAGNTSGRSPVPHGYPHNSAVHNDTLYVSQDAYNVTPYTFPVGPPPPLGYPSTVWELQGYAQIAGFDPTWHAFIRGAIATSPVGIHDVAVTNVTSAKTVIGQGYGGNVTVTVQNQGNFTETFNVTVYANTTSVASQNVTLISGNSTTLTFTWNTTGFAYGNYTISAYALPVQGETSTGDNTLSDGTVIISHLGDITGDGKCDIQDLARVSAAFGSIRVNDPSDPRYGQYWHPVTCPTCPHTPNADITNDEKVDIQDLARTSANFGWHE